MRPEFSRTNYGRVMADFVAPCSEKKEERFLFVCLSLPEGGCFIGDFCRCDHSVQNLMVSNNTVRGKILEWEKIGEFGEL